MAEPIQRIRSILKKGRGFRLSVELEKMSLRVNPCESRPSYTLWVETRQINGSQLPVQMLQPFLYEVFLFLSLACYQSKDSTQEQADQESEGGALNFLLSMSVPVW